MKTNAKKPHPAHHQFLRVIRGIGTSDGSYSNKFLQAKLNKRKGVIFMRTKISELCPSCRKIADENGRTTEFLLRIIYSDPRFADWDDERVNMMLYAHLEEGGGCYDCKDLVLNRSEE
jgi:hypothetical protein